MIVNTHEFSIIDYCNNTFNVDRKKYAKRAFVDTDPFAKLANRIWEYDGCGLCRYIYTDDPRLMLFAQIYYKSKRITVDLYTARVINGPSIFVKRPTGRPRIFKHAFDSSSKNCYREMKFKEETQ